MCDSSLSDGLEVLADASDTAPAVNESRAGDLLKYRRSVVAALHEPDFCRRQVGPWAWQLEHLRASLVGSGAAAAGPVALAGLRLPASCHDVLAQLAAVGKPSPAVANWFAGFTSTRERGEKDAWASSFLGEATFVAAEDEVVGLSPGSAVPGAVGLCAGRPGEALPQGRAVLVGAVGRSDAALFGTGEWNHYSDCRLGDDGPVMIARALRRGNDEVALYPDDSSVSSLFVKIKVFLLLG